MAQINIAPALRALAAALVVAGCSVTLQPIRTHGDLKTPPRKAASPVTTTAPLLDPNEPAPTCADPAPPQVPDPSARLVVQNGHEKLVHDVDISDDGRVLASAGNDGTVRVWDTRTGLLLRKVGTRGSFVSWMSLSGDGKTLAYYAPSNTKASQSIQVVDLDAGTEPRIVSEYVGPVDLSRDGRRAAVALSTLAIFDTKTGQKLHDIALDAKSASRLKVTFDDEDRRVAIGAGDEVVVVDVASEKVTHHVRLVDPNTGSLALIGGTLFARSYAGVAAMYPLDGRAPITLPDRLGAMAVTKDRIWAREQTSQKLRSFDAKDGREIPLAETPTANLLAASGDRSTIVLTKSRMDTGSELVVYDTGSLRATRTIEGRVLGINALAPSPDGKMLMTGSLSGTLMRWDMTRGELGPPLPSAEEDHGTLVSLAYNGRGDLLASTTGSYVVRIRNPASGKTLRQWSLKSGHFTKLVAFLPGTDELLTVRTNTRYERGTDPRVPKVTHELAVERWDLSGPRPAPPKQPLGEIARPQGKLVGDGDFDASAAALSPDGRRVAIVGSRGLLVMDTSDGKRRWTKELLNMNVLLPKQPDGVISQNDRAIAFSADGKSVLLSVAMLETDESKIQWYQSKLLVFDAATGAQKGVYSPGTNGPVAARGDLVLVGGVRPVLLDAKTLSVRSRVAPPDNVITAIALHRTRDLFLVGGDAGGTSVVRPDGTITATVLATPNGEYIATTPAGAYRSSLDGARSLAWSFSNPLEGFSFEQFSAQFDKPAAVAKELLGEEPPRPVVLSRPPQLFVEEPTARGVASTPSRSIPITARAASSSRVDRVRVFVDGRMAADRLVCAKEGRVSFDVPLHAGQNRVSVVAYDAAGYASNAHELDVVSTSPLGEKPDLWVVSIGVSSYPNMTAEQQLEYADDDARSVAESLARFVGPDKPFGKLVPTTLLDDAATVEGIDRALAGLAKMRPDDLAIVFLAGHGARLSEEKMVFMTSRAAFTRASAEANGVGWDRIEAALRRARGRVLMMLDACHSGHLSTEVVAPNEALARELAATNRAGVFVFSAARGSQFSYEVPPQGQRSAGRGLELAWEGQPQPKKPAEKELPGGHGLFTSALLEALSGEAPDRDRSGAVEVGELVDYVTERVRAASNGKQTPWVARREMFGEFMVAPAMR